MSRICGIELKSSQAIVVLLNCAGPTLEFIDLAQRKIELEDDESRPSVTAFHQAIVSFITEHKIDKIVLKKRAKKGTMAGGAISFKMEALIQLNGLVEVEFISGQAIAAAHKKNPFDTPSNLKKYQEAAFMAANLSHRKG